MSEVIEFPRRIPQVSGVERLSPGVDEMVGRHLDTIQTMTGFLDRIDYAAQFVHDIHVLRWSLAIDEAQFYDLAERVRKLLAGNLGALPSDGSVSRE